MMENAHFESKIEFNFVPSGLVLDRFWFKMMIVKPDFHFSRKVLEITYKMRQKNIDIWSF